VAHYLPLVPRRKCYGISSSTMPAGAPFAPSLNGRGYSDYYARHCKGARVRRFTAIRYSQLTKMRVVVADPLIHDEARLRAHDGDAPASGIWQLRIRLSARQPGCLTPGKVMASRRSSHPSTLVVYLGCRPRGIMWTASSKRRRQSFLPEWMERTVDEHRAYSDCGRRRYGSRGDRKPREITRV
jgi:hypothetical protein